MLHDVQVGPTKERPASRGTSMRHSGRPWVSCHQLTAMMLFFAYMAELQTCSDSGIMDVVDPRVYASKLLSKNDTDMPTFQQAMNGPDATEILSAMKLEIQTLKSQNTWVTVGRPKTSQC